MSRKIIECIPNFSEGCNEKVIALIVDSIRGVNGVRILRVDGGKDVNRTVVTFIGEPEPVLEAAFNAIAMATENIDMRTQTGKHPRIGAADVCPLVPVANVSMSEVIELSYRLAKRVGQELHIPIYMYEESAINQDHKALEDIRRGEYEGLEYKMSKPEWHPDYGPKSFNARSGAIVIGARKFLIAFNINLETDSVDIAHNIAAALRKKRSIDERFMHLKSTGWYIKDFNKVQVSLNLTDFEKTPIWLAYEEVKRLAAGYDTRVTGSELVGLVNRSAMMETGIFYSKSFNLKEEQQIAAAITALGLGELTPFNPWSRILEYLI